MRRATEDQPISLDELRELAKTRFGDMVKGVDDAATRDAIRGLIGRLVRP